jgi:SAM-dependent methyltransferase
VPDSGQNAAERQRWNNEYWASVWPRREQLTMAVTEVVLERLGLALGDRVLDVGTGGGVAALAAARIVGSSGVVVGADISAPLVALATRRAQELEADNARFVLADVQSDAIDGAPFTAAISQFGVMFFDEPVVAFANLRAQLAPGGRLGFVCWQAVARNPWFVGPALAPFIAPPPAPGPGKSQTGPFTLADPDHTAGVLEAAGWSAIEQTEHARTVRVRRDAIVDDPQLTFLGVEDAQLEAARTAVAEFLAPLEREDSHYDAPLAFRVVSATA